jgi:CHASE3 domain sensor protein
MSRRTDHLVKELRELAKDPDYHPMHRALFEDAGDRLQELQEDIDALRRQGADHA